MARRSIIRYIADVAANGTAAKDQLGDAMKGMMNERGAESDASGTDNGQATARVDPRVDG
jgi:hypothetical protein